MKNYKIAISVLLFGCFFLTACGLKRPPKLDKEVVVTYPGKYPNPKLGEVTTCPEQNIEGE